MDDDFSDQPLMITNEMLRLYLKILRSANWYCPEESLSNHFHMRLECCYGTAIPTSRAVPSFLYLGGQTSCQRQLRAA